MMKMQARYILSALVSVALSTIVAPQPVEAGQFTITQVKHKVLSNTTTQFRFDVNARAVWEGNQQTAGFDRLFLTLWWVTDLGWCTHPSPDPEKDCQTFGYVWDAPPFEEGDEIYCDSFGPACAAHKVVDKPCCEFDTLEYKGRADVVNLHAGTSLDDQKFSPEEVVPCQFCEEPPNCLVGGMSKTFSLPASGGPQIVHAVPHGIFRTPRTDTHAGMQNVLDEWVILAIDREEDGAVSNVAALAASTSGYADFRRDLLIEGIAVTRRSLGTQRGEFLGKGSLEGYFRPGRSILLVVDEPVHPRNDRWIEPPLPRLRPGSVQGETGDEALAVVRADFGEDRSLIDFQVLYSDRPLTGDERSFLAANLGLEYLSEKPHRAVLFAVLRLDGGTVTIQRSRTVRPRCCCVPSPGNPCNENPLSGA